MSRAPVFLARASYRQRRIRDAARALPVLGTVLCLIPLLWPESGPDRQLTSSALIYLFGVWVLLILLSALVARFVRVDDPADAAETGAGPGGRRP